MPVAVPPSPPLAVIVPPVKATDPPEIEIVPPTPPLPPVLAMPPLPPAPPSATMLPPTVTGCPVLRRVCGQRGGQHQTAIPHSRGQNRRRRGRGGQRGTTSRRGDRGLLRATLGLSRYRSVHAW